MKIRYLALALAIAGCQSAPQPPVQTPLQVAQEQVAISSIAIQGAAVAATAAHKAGILKPGPVETDIVASANAGRQALDQANAQLKAGSTGGAMFYVQQIATFVATIRKDLASIGVKQP